MILNGYTILAAFLCIVRFALAFVVLVSGVVAMRRHRRQRPPDRPIDVEGAEDVGYLTYLSASVLIGLNVLSWPILYLLLQSYVQEWPGVMCIYGVTQIGAGSAGGSRFLPTLVAALQWVKPLVVFCGGAAFMVYIANRRTQTAPLTRSVLGLMVLTGLISVSDSLVEGTYLAIPKTELRLSGGCCTTTLDVMQQAGKFQPNTRIDDSYRRLLPPGYFGLNTAIVAGLAAFLRKPRRFSLRAVSATATVGSLISVPVNLLFLAEVAAPAILGLQFHRCPYDLVNAAPESLLTVVLYAAGVFCCGWSLILDYVGHNGQTRAFLPEYLERLLFVACFCFAGAMILMTSELLLN